MQAMPARSIVCTKMQQDSGEQTKRADQIRNCAGRKLHCCERSEL